MSRGLRVPRYTYLQLLASLVRVGALAAALAGVAHSQVEEATAQPVAPADLLAPALDGDPQRAQRFRTPGTDDNGDVLSSIATTIPL